MTSTTDSGVVTGYRYDGDGKRVDRSSNGVVDTKYEWDTAGGLPELALERNGAGAVTRRWVQGPTGPAWMSIPTGAFTDPVTYVYHRDHLGSVTDLTTAAGASVASYAYEPFGQQIGTDPVGAPANPMRFTGEYLDSETQDYHLRARQHDPTTGRFGAVDPVTPEMDKQGVSTYAYVGNMPGVYLDPSGMSWYDPRDWSVPIPGTDYELRIPTSVNDVTEGYQIAADTGYDSWTGIGAVRNRAFTGSYDCTANDNPDACDSYARDAAIGGALYGLSAVPLDRVLGRIPGVNNLLGWLGRKGAGIIEQCAARLSRFGGQAGSLGNRVRISKLSADWATKGAHIHVGGVELAVRPGYGGTLVFKPVFSSTPSRVAKLAIQEASNAIKDPKFRAQLARDVLRTRDMLRQGVGGSQGAAKSGELNFLLKALGKM